MAASFSDADLAELKERIQAAMEGGEGVPIALLREGINATKPKRTRKPPKAPKPPPDPRVTTLKRLSSRITNASARIQRAWETISKVKLEYGDRAVYTDPNAREAYQKIDAGRSIILKDAEYLASMVRSYFDCADPEEKPE